MIRSKEKGLSCKYFGHWIKAVALSLLLITYSFSFAQKFTAATQYKEVPQNFRFDVTYTVENGDMEKFIPPKFEGFDAYGPSQSQNISIVNGRMSKSFSYIYTLQPKKQGDFVIPPATAVVNGKSMQSNSISIKVTAPQKQNRQSNTAPDPYGSGNTDDVDAQIAKNLFVVVSPSKNVVYEGDQLTLTYKLYYNNIPYQGLSITKAPAYNGFLSEDFKMEENRDPVIEVYKGKKYYMQEFKRVALFPQKPGTYTIEPMRFNGTVFLRVQDPFAFFATLEPYDYSFSSNTIEIQVIPLPKPQPANFSGAVGNFTFSANYDKTKVKVHEPVSLKIAYTGTGNLKLITAPKLEFPEEFEAYEPKIKEDYATQSSVVSGAKSFEYILVPQDGGKFTLPAYEFGYFDPAQKKYTTFKLPETLIEVEGTAAPSANLMRILKRDKQEGKKQDIYDIMKIDEPSSFFFNSTAFWGLSVSPVVLFLLGFFLRNREYNEAELLLLRRKKATRMAMKRLSTAKKLMHPASEKAFYNEVIRALWQYVSDKLYIKTSDLSKENIGQKLQHRNVSQENIDSLNLLLDTCEQALFSQQGQAEQMQETYTNAMKWITETDEQLTGKNS